MEQLAGRVAVITGGASGIGLATGRALVAEGMRVVLVDIEAGAVQSAAGELGATAMVCDVGDHAAVEALADDVIEHFGAVDLVFNNAGVAIGGPIVEMSHADWEWIMRVDLWGPIHGVEAFVPRMVAQATGGHVLFTASFAGLVPNVGLGPYCVAKYGVVALAEVLQRELRQHDIGVSVLCPMRVGTNIGTSERNRPADLGGRAASPRVPDQSADNAELAGDVLPVEVVAAQVVDAVKRNRLYVVPHAESRSSIRRRFERIDRSFDEVAPAG